MTSGYCDCACRDCFDVAVGPDCSYASALCGDCEAAGCESYPLYEDADGVLPPDHATRYACKRTDDENGSDRLEKTVESFTAPVAWREAFQVARDEYRDMIAGYDPNAGEDGDSLDPDVYSALSVGADAIKHLDVSSLVDATLEAMGTGEGCVAGECLQALWLWEDEHGHAAVLAVLTRLAG